LSQKRKRLNVDIRLSIDLKDLRFAWVPAIVNMGAFCGVCALPLTVSKPGAVSMAARTASIIFIGTSPNVSYEFFIV
jgi:hypothetical protein